MYVFMTQMLEKFIIIDENVSVSEFDDCSSTFRLGSFMCECVLFPFCSSISSNLIYNYLS